MTERRLIALDELRGLAISAVIISHVALVYRDDSTIAFGLAMPALGVGVDLFFVISGFVIFENATRMIARAPQNFWRGAARLLDQARNSYRAACLGDGGGDSRHARRERRAWRVDRRSGGGGRILRRLSLGQLLGGR